MNNKFQQNLLALERTTVLITCAAFRLRSMYLLPRCHVTLAYAKY